MDIGHFLRILPAGNDPPDRDDRRSDYDLTTFMTMAYMIFVNPAILGTVIAVGQEAKLLDENARPPQLERILLIDSLGAVGGEATGASSVTSYIESGAAGLAPPSSSP